jgi:hypothetical protein
MGGKGTLISWKIQAYGPESIRQNECRPPVRQIFEWTERVIHEWKLECLWAVQSIRVAEAYFLFQNCQSVLCGS